LSTAVVARGLAARIATCFLPFAAGYFLSYLYRTVNAVIGPNLVAEIGVDAAGLGLLTSAYFFGFATVQIPLGIALDRVGPRRTEATLLLVAAVGALVFATASSVQGLAAGRCLIGIGVAIGLMAAFKANGQFWPRERLAFANGALMACGGLGALAATLPVEFLLHVIDWRGLFVMLAVLTLGVAALLHFVAPQAEVAPPMTLAEEGRTLRLIFASPVFWRIAPTMILAQSTYLAYLTLWSGPWLRDVAGYDRVAAAGILAATTAAFTLGAFLQGLVADRAGRRDISLTAVLGASTGCFILAQLPIVMTATQWSPLLWPAFALLGAGSTLGYAILQHHFPGHVVASAAA
jgi:MFS family permease